MAWDHRLAAFLLAGGSLAGCDSSYTSTNYCPDMCCSLPDGGPCGPVDAGPPPEAGACDADPDPCCGLPDSLTCAGGHTLDAGTAPEAGICNANPDPCCGYDAGTCPFSDGGVDAGGD